MSESIVRAICDANGNLVPTLSDGTNNRFAVDARISGGAGVSSQNIQTSQTVANQFRTPLRRSGSSDMVVNGGGTAAVFNMGADSARTLVVTDISLVASAGTVNMTGARFLSLGGALPNGLLVEVVSSGTATTLATIRISEDFLYAFNGTPVAGLAGAQDYVVAKHFCLTTLVAASSDLVRVTVRDNLTAGGLLGLGGTPPTLLQGIVGGYKR